MAKKVDVSLTQEDVEVICKLIRQEFGKLLDVLGWTDEDIIFFLFGSFLDASDSAVDVGTVTIERENGSKEQLFQNRDKTQEQQKKVEELSRQNSKAYERLKETREDIREKATGQSNNDGCGKPMGSVFQHMRNTPKNAGMVSRIAHGVIGGFLIVFALFQMVIGLIGFVIALFSGGKRSRFK